MQVNHQITLNQLLSDYFHNLQNIQHPGAKISNIILENAYANTLTDINELEQELVLLGYTEGSLCLSRRRLLQSHRRKERYTFQRLGWICRNHFHILEKILNDLFRRDTRTRISGWLGFPTVSPVLRPYYNLRIWINHILWKSAIDSKPLLEKSIQK